MKVSVTLSVNDVAFLDSYARKQGLKTRSAAVQGAVRLLRTAAISAPYEAAWDEWQGSGDDAAWERAPADRLKP